MESVRRRLSRPAPGAHPVNALPGPVSRTRRRRRGRASRAPRARRWAPRAARRARAPRGLFTRRTTPPNCRPAPEKGPKRPRTRRRGQKPLLSRDAARSRATRLLFSRARASHTEALPPRRRHQNRPRRRASHLTKSRRRPPRTACCCCRRRRLLMWGVAADRGARYRRSEGQALGAGVVQGVGQRPSQRSR